MAEIEFKRRGTPLWAVLLVLIVIAGIVWALVGRGGAPAAAVADTTAAVAHDSTSAAAVPPADSARQAAAAGVPVTAPASATGPAVQLAKWVDSTKVPAAADRQPEYIGKGLQLVAGALQERVPFAGVQINMLRAMGDTLQMPNLQPAQYLNAAQAGFFAVAYALRSTSAGGPMNEQAAMLQLTTPLAKQSEQVRSFFVTAADVLKAPIKAEAVPPSSPPPPKGDPNATPPSQRQPKPAPAPQTKG